MVKDLINVDNLNPLALEITKTYFSSNNVRSLDYETFFNLFISSYSIFKEQVDELENSNMTIEEMRDAVHKNIRETN